jgi:hypothetical protein
MNEQEYMDFYDSIDADYEYIALKYSKEIKNPAIFFGILLDIVIRHMMICAPNKDGVMEVLKQVVEHIEEKIEEKYVK